MKTSPTITPFRWYDKFYDQNRYDVDCKNECEFKLITDRGHLLPFQFSRTHSPALIESWLLRDACVEAEPQLLSQQLSKFYGDFNSDWDVSGLDCDVRTISTSPDRTTSTGATRTLTVAECTTALKSCNILRSGATNAVKGVLSGLLTIGKSYRLYVTIGDVNLSVGSNLNLSFFNGTNGSVDLITGVNSLGAYEVEFTATDTDFGFYVHNSTPVDLTDYIGIESIQIVELFEQQPEDIELDKSLVKLTNIVDDDYFIYCGDKLTKSLPTGDYYSIIKTDDGLIYYSEIITVKDFIPETSKYYKLEWYNTCDIQDVIYQEIGDCGYKNILYLEEAMLSKPEYLFSEEVEQDGNNTEIPILQKLEKNLEFIVGKCPEYITDSLTGTQIHDEIYITSPIRASQLQPTEAMKIKNSRALVAPIFEDCFSNVTLRLLLVEAYIDRTCCENNSVTPDVCIPCDFLTYKEVNDFSLIIVDGVLSRYAFAYDDPILNDGLYLFVFPTGWVQQGVPTGTRVCCLSTSYTYSTAFNVWFPLPLIEQILYNAEVFAVRGLAYPGTFVHVEYSLDAGASWIPSTIGTDTDFASDILVPLVYQAGILFRVRNYSFNCDYRYSPVFDFDAI